MDLKNEPFQARWEKGKVSAAEDWQQAAQALGNLLLKNCPKWLIFVEGVGSLNQRHSLPGRSDRYADWHGANLRNARVNPIVLNHSAQKVVYSPHTYTQGVFPHDYL